MDIKDIPTAIVRKMYDNDPFSQWLGIRIEKIEVGQAVLSMRVRDEMCNGFNVAHGGISFSLADSALAFASNSRGIKSLSVDTSINHLKPVMSGDVLTALTREDHVSTRFAVYSVEVLNQNNVKVALFKGTVYRTGKEWDIYS